LDVYPTLDNPITYDIFNALPYELKNKYIGMNIGLTDAQYNSIQSEKNLLKRYAQMAEKKFEMWLKNVHVAGDFPYQDFQLKDSEIDVLHKYGILDASKLTDDKVKDMLSNLRNKQKTVDVLLTANVPLTYSNVDNLLSYSRDTQPTIDTLLNKNIDLTDKNVSSLIWSYCTNQQKKRFNDLKVKQLGALKLKQQLSETKFKYRDFYSYLK
jgi:hypothetical protein